MGNAIDVDLAEPGKTPDPQNVEYTSKSQNPDDISASERFLKLIGSRKNNEDLYDAAINVVRELDVLREQNEKLVQSEHQNQEKMLLLNQADEALKREKGAFEDYIRRLLSLSRIKSIMKNFVDSSLPNLEQSTRIQYKTHVEFLAVVLKNNDRFTNFVKQLLSFSLKTQTEIDSIFHTFWKCHDLPFGHGLDPADIENVENNDLCCALIELLNAESVDHALQIFNRQKCDIWERKGEILSLDDMKALKALSFAAFPSSLLKNCDVYVYDMPKIGIKVVETTSKEYKQCLWILYKSEVSKVVEIRRKLEERWPNFQRSKRMDLFATAYATLFNIVSDQDDVGPAFSTPFTNCEPTSEDFYQYIQSLTIGQSSDISFVAETLCIP